MTNRIPKINFRYFLIVLNILCFAGLLEAQTPAGFTWQVVENVNFGDGANHFTIKAASAGLGSEVELGLNKAVTYKLFDIWGKRIIEDAESFIFEIPANDVIFIHYQNR